MAVATPQLVELECPDCGKTVAVVEPSRTASGLPIAWCWNTAWHRRSKNVRMVEVAS